MALVWLLDDQRAFLLWALLCRGDIFHHLRRSIRTWFFVQGRKVSGPRLCKTKVCSSWPIEEISDIFAGVSIGSSICFSGQLAWNLRGLLTRNWDGKCLLLLTFFVDVAFYLYDVITLFSKIIMFKFKYP